MIQIKLNAATAVVERRDANWRLRDAFIKAFDAVKQRHVQVEHEAVIQLVFWRLSTVDGHSLGNHPVGAEHNHIVMAKGQVQIVLPVAIHLDLIERLAVLEHRHGDVFESVFGLLVLQAAAHYERFRLGETHESKQQEGNRSHRLSNPKALRSGWCRVGLHHGRSAEKYGFPHKPR